MNHLIECEKCQGSGLGRVISEHRWVRDHYYNIERYVACSACDGHGKIAKKVQECDCNECENSYYVYHEDGFVSRHSDFLSSILEAQKLSARSNAMTEVYCGPKSDRPVFRTWGDEYVLNPRDKIPFVDDVHNSKRG